MVFELEITVFELEVTVFELGLEVFELEVTVFKLDLGREMKLLLGQRLFLCNLNYSVSKKQPRKLNKRKLIRRKK